MPICANSPDSSSSSSSGSRVWITHLAVLGVAIAASAGVHFFLRRRSGKFRSRVVGIIPARFASSRFEGKPLALSLEDMGERKPGLTFGGCCCCYR
ncbi:3-deoxy-manno-octulosonate cytidylyltransferase-like isoform X2 [Zingiber officinale]|uniref:3-deoxy-manno-octulosonate cytidylyltransferase-like isoform X2 n=1 Tax=Zingiber officinale TaxID=94328 RepID=UPI001C4D5002|nr:3-deoxy-manno-octulosonate cytidylyltransferase-like isoform X2 [Zingiber officinale]